MRDVRMQKEIIVHANDRIGVLAEISRLLCDMGINLLSVRVRTEPDEERAAIHLVTTSQSYATEALEAAGFPVDERDVVVVDLPHHPGFLCRVTEALARKGISLHDLHVTVPEGSSMGTVVFACTNNHQAVQMLRGR